MSDDAYAVVVNGRTYVEMYAAQKLIQKVRAEQADEIERLRAALRDISLMDKRHEHDLFSATRVAQAALEGE